MSSRSIHRVRPQSALNDENPIKNIKNNLVKSNRKQGALRLLTNTVQSTKKSDVKGVNQLKVLPMQKFDTEVEGISAIYDTNDELSHISCTINETGVLPSSMTCNIDMLSNFFNRKNNDESDWFLEDFNNIMMSKIQKTFEDFGEPKVNNDLPSLPPMPVMDFSDCMF